ncbi:MAG: cupin domain-containing protein [Vicinamibacteria bacterium]
MSNASSLPPAESLAFPSLIVPTPGGIASRVLAKTTGGNVTLFALDGGQGLTEHTTPFDALVMTLEGHIVLTIGGKPVDAVPGTVVVMPANVPHAVEAKVASRMLLTMLRDVKPA